MPDINPFEYQQPDEQAVSRIQYFRTRCEEVYQAALALPESRERSLAITKLEEFSMWINKALVFHQE